ncbi:MAG: glycoside hydrolase family 16 protein [Armatimonadetes bacterium]|nr:glycoside hydrolase family 16 protein [Armatimonadota bacterium]
MRLFPVLGVAAALLAALPVQAGRVKTPAPIRGKGYRLVQDWDFGATVKTKKQLYDQFYTRYVYNNGTLDTLNDEWERYRDDNNHVLDGHVLSLVARAPGGLKPGGIESGMLRSKWTGEYGYYECRMKVPAGRGMWPAFWLNPQDGKWPPEIDVVEIVNNGRDTTKSSFHNVHPGKTDKVEDVQTKLDKWSSYRPGFDYADGFHTFAVEWTPDTVRHYVDDVLVAERRFHWTHEDGSDGGPAHVLVNLAVGGSWPGPPTSAGEFPAALEIQYIRVWQCPRLETPAKRAGGQGAR